MKISGLQARELARHFQYLTIYNMCNENDKVLEIGCGDGKGPASQGPPLIAKKVKEYTAIDKCEYKNPPFNFAQADIDDYPLIEKYDKIICLGVIEYVKNQVGLVKKVSNALKNGGVSYWYEGLTWQTGQDKLPVEQIANNFKELLIPNFKSVGVFGAYTGIIVLEGLAKEGIFCIASN